MILKDKITTYSSDRKIKAGIKQELDVAFYLRRAFSDIPHIYVFNDLKFEHNNEVAQIDHLILYPHGFILIESKSIAGEVSINKHNEWSRSYRGQWRGIPSPIQQVDMQMDIVKHLLQKVNSELLPLYLGVQEGFGGREWAGICAISNNAIIKREDTNKTLEKRLIKSEFIGEKAAEIMKVNKKGKSTVGFFNMDNRPKFNDESMRKIAKYLLDSDLSTNTDNNKSALHKTQVKEATSESLISNDNIKLICKSCSNIDGLIPLSGRYGYFIRCPQCQSNTALKSNCNQCGSEKTKVSKRKVDYSLKCTDCSHISKLEY